MRVTVVSAADSGYFPLLQGLILSLQSHAATRPLPVTVLDVGLSDAERVWLASHKAEVRPVKLPPLPPREDGRPAVTVAQRLRPSLPSLVPGFDMLMWMDADLWVQLDWVVPLYIRAALGGAMAIVPEVHVAYPSLYGARQLRGMHATYRRLFDQATADALAPNPTINSGCFALMANAPHWRLWAETLDAVLAKDSFYYAEQFALNHLLYTRPQEAPARFLPAACNWICHQALPVIDHRNGRFCDPVPPFPPLGIVHLTVHAKDGEHAMKTTDGKPVTRSLRYVAAPAPATPEAAPA